MNKKAMPYAILALLAGAGILIQQCTRFPHRSQSETPSLTAQTSQSKSISTSETSTAIFTLAYEGCYFVWSSHELTEVSASLQKDLQDLQSKAQARATAFGEDCIYADGRSEFGAAETDFYITLFVDDFSDEQGMGEWMSRVMPLLENIPPDQIQGPQPGFVEFTFKTSGVDNLILRVPIAEYLSKAKGLSGAALFRHFHPEP